LHALCLLLLCSELCCKYRKTLDRSPQLLSLQVILTPACIQELASIRTCQSRQFSDYYAACIHCINRVDIDMSSTFVLRKDRNSVSVCHSLNCSLNRHCHHHSCLLAAFALHMLLICTFELISGHLDERCTVSSGIMIPGSHHFIAFLTQLGWIRGLVLY